MSCENICPISSKEKFGRFLQIVTVNKKITANDQNLRKYRLTVKIFDSRFLRMYQQKSGITIGNTKKIITNSNGRYSIETIPYNNEFQRKSLLRCMDCYSAYQYKGFPYSIIIFSCKQFQDLYSPPQISKFYTT